jgi:hypothetical protein
MDFLLWLILAGTGYALIRYRFQIHNFVGSWGWAENYLGGTVNAIVLTGAGLIFVGFCYPFWVFDDFGKVDIATIPMESSK